MASGTLAIESYWFAPIAPDGSECQHCGDMCLLSQHRLEFRTGYRVIETEHYLCGSCAEALLDPTTPTE